METEKIKFDIANINNELAPYFDIIKSATNRAIIWSKKLNIHSKITILFTKEGFGANGIKEDGIGGRSYFDYLCIISIDIKKEKINEDIIFETICHELAHVVRAQKTTGWDDTLIKRFLNEGIATTVSLEAMHDENIFNKIGFFNSEIISTTDIENKKLLDIFSKKLLSEDFDYHDNELLYDGNKEKDIPRWAGYKLGYYLFKVYLEKTHKKPSEAFYDSYDEIIKTVL